MAIAPELTFLQANISQENELLIYNYPLMFTAKASILIHSCAFLCLLGHEHVKGRPTLAAADRLLHCRQATRAWSRALTNASSSQTRMDVQ